MTTSTIFALAMYWFITSIIAIYMSIDNKTKVFDIICFIILSFLFGTIIVPAAIGIALKKILNFKNKTK